MIWYNLKISIRRIIKNLTFSGINVFGLAIGVFSFFILFIYVLNEGSYDKHFSDYKNIYRAESALEAGNIGWARSLGIIHEASATIPEIEVATQFSHCKIGTIKIDEHQYQQNDIMSVDESFIDMFSVKTIVGDIKDITKQNTAFISEEVAKKYFKDKNPIGQIIDVAALQYARNIGKYEIRGIVKNTPAKTHFNYHILLSQKGGLHERYDLLSSNKLQWAYHYLKLKNGASPEAVSDKLLGYFEKSKLKQTRGPKNYVFFLRALSDIHLKSDCRFELKDNSGKVNINLFLVISMVILLVSLLNFINLTIAKLIKRSKELGLKKSFGAFKSQLVGQVMVEALTLCSLSILIALVLIEIAKPFISRFFEVEFNIYYTDPAVYLSIAGVLIICGILCSFFVGFYLLGKSKTVNTLAKNNNFSGSKVLSSLLIFQVTVVTILLACTFFVNKQINYISEKKLGFDKDNVVVLQLKDLTKDPAVFVSELEGQSEIVSVGMSAQHFGYPTQQFPLEGYGINGSAEMIFANYNYLKTMGIKLITNRIKTFNDTIEGLVVNNHLYQRLLDEYGSMDAIDSYMANEEVASDQVRVKILGVAEDFNYNSAHQEIGDYVILLGESRFRARFIHVRLASGNLIDAMSRVKNVWEKHYSGQEFNYFFMDEKIAQQYKAETMLRRILYFFSIIGILISIIGISALSLYISQQRTKEIGIRKVNGAGISEVLIILNNQFIKWVSVAIAIATPIAWYVMSKWFENYAYKTTLSWWVFAGAGIIALAIVLVTVLIQSWNAANKNPVEALRYE